MIKGSHLLFEINENKRISILKNIRLIILGLENQEIGIEDWSKIVKKLMGR